MTKPKLDLVTWSLLLFMIVATAFIVINLTGCGECSCNAIPPSSIPDEPKLVGFGVEDPDVTHFAPLPELPNEHSILIKSKE